MKSTKTWNQCLSDRFNSPLRQTHEQYSDFELVCVKKAENGEQSERRFFCHKVVLSLNSQYYEKMFSGSYSEHVCYSVSVTDVSGDTMAKILKYIYTGMLPPSEIASP